MGLLFFHALTLLVSVPLLVLGLCQLSHPFSFLMSVYSYKLVDSISGMLLVTFLPSFQIVLALALLWDFRNRKVHFQLAGLLYIGLALVQTIASKRCLEIPVGWLGIIQGRFLGPLFLVLLISGIFSSVIGYLLANQYTEKINPEKGRKIKVAT